MGCSRPGLVPARGLSREMAHFRGHGRSAQWSGGAHFEEGGVGRRGEPPAWVSSGAGPGAPGHGATAGKTRHQTERLTFASSGRGKGHRKGLTRPTIREPRGLLSSADRPGRGAVPTAGGSPRGSGWTR